jgi:ribosomal protein L37E
MTNNEQAVQAENARIAARYRDRKILAEWSKEDPLPPLCIDPPKRGYHAYITCRRCGAEIYQAVWKYCPNCGQAVKHADTAGTQGWTERTTNEAWRKICQTKPTTLESASSLMC